MSQDPAPDPAETTGLEPGGGVAPGDTPPMASSEPEATGGPRRPPNAGPATPNRTPMIIGLVVLSIVVVLAVGFVLAQVFGGASGTQ